MKTIARLALSCVAALSFSASALAGVIVDTGPGLVPYGTGAGMFEDQWLANSFTLSQRQTITGINGWLTGTLGTVQIAVRSTEKGLPGTMLFSADAKSNSLFSGAWVGAAGLDWTLDAGDYFVAFQMPAGYTFRGAMDTHPTTPTGKGAFTDELGKWHLDATSSLHLGFQIFGEPAATQDPADVPEPSSAALAGLALAAMAFARKRAGKTRA
jgi:hypothetical protein